MKKADLVSHVKAATDLTVAESSQFISAFLEVVADELKAGGDVPLPGFGKFSVKFRAERLGRNPQTREEIKIPACKVAVFRPAKALKDAIQ